MAEIVARWEWRTFARKIALRTDLRDHPRTRRAESSELYLACSAARGNPKIRDGRIDVKILQQVDDHGLEQWKPVLKAPFPLSAEQLAEVYRALGLVAPPGEPGGCSLDALRRRIDEHPAAWTVSVQKDRSLYDLAGCVVEWSEVSFEGDVFRTVAAEAPDPTLVWNTVARLGLSDRENISYVKAIQRLAKGALA